MNETIVAVIAIAASVLGSASMILHFVAPRTKTTVDDRLRDDIDEILEFIRTGRVK